MVVRGVAAAVAVNTCWVWMLMEGEGVVQEQAIGETALGQGPMTAHAELERA